MLSSAQHSNKKGDHEEEVLVNSSVQNPNSHGEFGTWGAGKGKQLKAYCNMSKARKP